MTKATIEIFVRPIKYTFGLVQHIYLLSSDNKGNKKILRAGPETITETGMLIDDLKVVYADYTERNKELLGGDFEPQNEVKIYTITGTDSAIQAKMDKMWEIGKLINAGNYDYKLPLCLPAFCHVQNSNTAGYLMAKAIDVDLKPILEEKKLWAPGIDGSFDHTMMDRVTHGYIDGLTIMQGVLDGVRASEAQNTNLGLAAIFNQAKEKVEQFRSHQKEYSAAEEYARFDQLIKDLDLGFVLDHHNAYKYIAYPGIWRPNIYGNSVTEMFSQYVQNEKKKNLEDGDNREMIYTIKNVIGEQISYELDMPANSKVRGSWHKEAEFKVETNIDYDPSYTDFITKQCNSLTEFRDTLSPLHEKLFDICTFAGVNPDHLQDEL